MKKEILILTLSAITMSIFGQTHVDALRYSQHTIGGTARSVSMGGAFGALGGDFSTLSTNPAGLGVYRKSEFMFTPEVYTSKTTSRYFGSVEEEKKSNFNFSNLGFVASFIEGDDFFKGVNFGVGFNRIANFHKNTTIDGVNENSSFGDYMAGDANNYGLGTFTSALFYDAYVINGDDELGYWLNGVEEDEDDGYIDGNDNFIPTEQRILKEESGRISERTFSASANLGNMLYLGTTVGWHMVKYDSESIWREYRANESSYQYFDYYEKLKVRGDGLTAKFGAIFTPFKALRVGAAYHLPVYYKLNEEYSTNISSRYINWDVYKPVDGNGNEIDYLENSYDVQTPSKFIASVASVIGGFFILSADFEFLDYGSMNLKPTKDFDLQNEEIERIYSDALNIRLGTELKLGNTYLRGGAGFYDSPFASNEENNDAYQISYSGGIGFRNDSFFIDIAYQYANYDERNVLYNVNIDGADYAPAANIDNKNSRVMTTIGFRF